VSNGCDFCTPPQTSDVTHSPIHFECDRESLVGVSNLDPGLNGCTGVLAVTVPPDYLPPRIVCGPGNMSEMCWDLT